MARLFWVTMMVGTFLGGVAATTERSHIVTLTSENFDEVVSRSAGVTFVEFYAPWCGHCKKLEPELEKAAKELHGSVVKICKMNAEEAENRPIAKKYGVSGFPTLRVFAEGKLLRDYGRGGRSARHIVSYLKRLMTPSVIDLSSDKALTFASNGNGDNPVYLLLGGSQKVSTIFAAVADDVREHTWFGHVKDDGDTTIPPDVLATLGVERLPAIVAIHESSGVEVFAAFAAGEVVGNLKELLAAFVNGTRLPLVVNLDQSVFPVIAHLNRPTVLLLVSGGSGSAADDVGHRETMTGEEQDVVRLLAETCARQHRDGVQFATVDMSLLGEWVKMEMGIKGGATTAGPLLPMAVVYHKSKQEMWFDAQWRQRGETAQEAMESLLQDTVYTRRISPQYLKTAPFLHKLEREIEMNPTIASGLALVPVVLALVWWFVFSPSSKGGSKKRAATEDHDSAATVASTETVPPQRGANVRQRSSSSRVGEPTKD